MSLSLWTSLQFIEGTKNGPSPVSLLLPRSIPCPEKPLDLRSYPTSPKNHTPDQVSVHSCACRDTSGNGLEAAGTGSLCSCTAGAGVLLALASSSSFSVLGSGVSVDFHTRGHSLKIEC